MIVDGRRSVSQIGVAAGHPKPRPGSSGYTVDCSGEPADVG